jgi:sterol desaturase/sphingolipid hydroxylase (fatty acid hydroxylase superfamily)
LLWRGAWPLLLASSCAILACGFALERPTSFFNLSYAWLVLWVWLLERYQPYRLDWRENDGQLGPDLSHTLLNKGLVQLALVSVVGHSPPAPPDAFLSTAPLFVQVGCGLVATEFGLYWAHRLKHEWSPLWRFHAVHHSVERLWFVNTGRFHCVDSLLAVGAGLPFLLLSGLSTDAIIWISAITAYIGILTHCNVAMRCSGLNLIFNTPDLHRWHHAIDGEIGNHNYGENLVLWDRLFGTYWNPPRGEVGVIGIREHMPQGFLGQLAVPFTWRHYQAARLART